MLMRICCFLAPPELGELGKPGSLARRLALGRPLALLCSLVRGMIRLIIVNYIRVAVPMTAYVGAGFRCVAVSVRSTNKLSWPPKHRNSVYLGPYLRSGGSF